MYSLINTNQQPHETPRLQPTAAATIVPATLQQKKQLEYTNNLLNNIPSNNHTNNTNNNIINIDSYSYNYKNNFKDIEEQRKLAAKRVQMKLKEDQIKLEKQENEKQAILYAQKEARYAIIIYIIYTMAMIFIYNSN